MKNKIKAIASLATKSILYEVTLSPKPGLVDRFNNGAHKDMNFYHFIDSAFALHEHLENYLIIGYQHESEDFNQLFSKLRREGLLAEQSMFRATGNVNTHKGLNFAYALILGAIGYYINVYSNYDKLDIDKIFDYVKEMARPIVDKDFNGITDKNAKTYGEKLYIKYGILGPRGEAASGYTYLIKEILPYIDKRMSQDVDEEAIYLEVLILMMSKVEDGNLIHRGGIDQWRKVKKEAANIYKRIYEGENVRLLLSEYNNILVERYLSPGGSADLLCLSIFLTHLKNQSF